MTATQRDEMIRKLLDAVNAGYITVDEYLTRSKAVCRKYFDVKYGCHGKGELIDIPTS